MTQEEFEALEALLRKQRARGDGGTGSTEQSSLLERKVPSGDTDDDEDDVPPIVAKTNSLSEHIFSYGILLVSIWYVYF